MTTKYIVKPRYIIRWPKGDGSYYFTLKRIEAFVIPLNNEAWIELEKLTGGVERLLAYSEFVKIHTRPL
jgi:hypothetical protein